MSDVSIHPTPKMDSAAAELMSLSFRLEKHPDFADDAQRMRHIAGWIYAGHTSDMEMSLMRIIGGLIRTMRRRNHVFNEDLPMEPQFTEFLGALPDPLPGQPGYVDQNALPPIERRDTFEAQVEIADVRIWTAHDEVPRAVARECRVMPPGGIAGDTMIFAQGSGEIALLTGEAIRTLSLRSSGNALRVVMPPPGNQAEPTDDRGPDSPAVRDPAP